MNLVTGFLQFLLFLTIIFGGISLMFVIINTFGWEGTTPCDEPIKDFRPFNSAGCRSL